MYSKAGMRIILATLFAFIGYINLTNGRYLSMQVMTYSALAFYGSFGVMICALVPISLSRIVAASKPQAYDKVSYLFTIRVCYTITISDSSPNQNPSMT